MATRAEEKQKVIGEGGKFRHRGTDERRLSGKLRSLIPALEEGDKAKICAPRVSAVVKYCKQIGMEVLNRVKDDFAELAVVESFPTKIEKAVR